MLSRRVRRLPYSPTNTAEPRVNRYSVHSSSTHSSGAPSAIAAPTRTRYPTTMAMSVARAARTPKFSWVSCNVKKDSSSARSYPLGGVTRCTVEKMMVRSAAMVSPRTNDPAWRVHRTHSMTPTMVATYAVTIRSSVAKVARMPIVCTPTASLPNPPARRRRKPAPPMSATTPRRYLLCQSKTSEFDSTVRSSLVFTLDAVGDTHSKAMRVPRVPRFVMRWCSWG
jgi:hypothetical protein